MPVKWRAMTQWFDIDALFILHSRLTSIAVLPQYSSAAKAILILLSLLLPRKRMN